MKKSFIVLLSTMLLLSGCQKFKNVANQLKSDLNDFIYSTRPQNNNPVFINIKLKEEPLAQKIQIVNGVKIVDKADIAAVVAEQTAMIDKLKALSSDIVIIYKYKYVLNALSVQVPANLVAQAQALSQSSGYASYQSTQFRRPRTLSELEIKKFTDLDQENSVKFIKAEEARGAYNLSGQKIKVGVLDTGVDYTHKMLGGAGEAAAYEAVNPDEANASFPNKVVVGGIDLVGTEYDSASEIFEKNIPHPDLNPIDEAGHGTHVAGTIAGARINDQSYSGVAPEAEIYAIKVFGADGSTNDNVVIAGFEYAIDPNNDGDLSDQLQVLNLSLGSSYGTSQVLYTEAIKNTTDAGTLVVASAGNSGHENYIVGSPSVSDDALSVAASRDNSYHIWHFDAAAFATPTQGEVITQIAESPIAKPLAALTEFKGKLVYVGLADKDFSDDIKLQLAGNVALIDRGGVTFFEKMNRAAAAGASAIVVANNRPGDPFGMGGGAQDEVTVPAVMINQATGDILKTELTKGDVIVDLKTSHKIAKPELIDTLTDFTSKGPRSYDSFLKPEISAPGEDIVSAAMSKGQETVAMSGTSMAAPHMSGVMALLVQRFPDLKPRELKALVMQTSQSISDENKDQYLLSEQGAGRVNVMAAAGAKAFALPESFSLGMQSLTGSKTIARTVTLHNISNETLKMDLKWNGNPSITIKAESVEIESKKSADVTVYFKISATGLTENSAELDGWVEVYSGTEKLIHIPELVVVEKVSSIALTSVKTLATSQEEATDSLTQINLTNALNHSGEVLVFNLLAQDQRKKQSALNLYSSTLCDLQAVGYRTIDKEIDGKGVKVLQVGFKTYDVNNHWKSCEPALLIDTNLDQNPEQELVGTSNGNLPGTTAGISQLVTYLLDSAIARDLRKAFELTLSEEKSTGKIPTDHYKPAVVAVSEFKGYNNSTVAIIEVEVSKLKLRDDGRLAVKALSMATDTDNVESDDYAAKDLNAWQTISIVPENQPYYGIKASYEVLKSSSKTIEISKGADSSSELLLLFPNNKYERSSNNQDSQIKIVTPELGE